MAALPLHTEALIVIHPRIIVRVATSDVGGIA